ncbi:MAG: energy transducer TonB [Candidatus Acidiferrum sp.]
MTRARTVLMLSALLAAVPCAITQESPEVLPKVVQHAVPIYPPLARQTRIQGEVRVKITTDGESVRDAEAETGHPLLRTAAVDNARTWKFVTHSPATFHVTFRYKLLDGNTDVEFLESPAIVEIVASPPELSIYYAWLGLGTWKAQMRSAHGKYAPVFKLYSSGPNGDWLDGEALGRNGEKEEIDFGHKEGDFLAFTITISQPDGQHVKTFFIGKMTKDKIVGTFVDKAGIRGEWTAVRVADSPNP